MINLSFITWTNQEILTLVEMLEKGKTEKEISNVINEKHFSGIEGYPTTRSERAVERKRQKLAKVGNQEANKFSNLQVEQIDVDQRWKLLRQKQEKYRTDSKFDNTGLAIKPAATKILSLSDIHFPFANLEMLEAAIDQHKDSDILVLNGDILDGYIYSSFEKSSTVAAIDEYNCALEFVAMCSDMFKEVYMTWGNHDARAEKALRRLGMTKESYGVLGPNLLKRISNGEKLNREGLVIEKLNFDNVFFPEVEAWWLQLGKTLFIHPHSQGSSKPGFTVTQWASKFRERLAPSSYDSIVCGHTHQCYKGIHNGILLIEQGCLSDYMSYAWNPNKVYLTNSSQGYAVIYQDENGNTDFNLSGFFYLGQLFPNDKPIYGGRNERRKDS